MDRALVAYEHHAGLHGTDDHADAVRGGVDHLAVADVDTAVAGIHGDVTGLGVAHARPSEEGVCRAQTRVATRQAVAHESGAIELAGSAGTPHVIGLADPAVGAVDDGVAGAGIVSGLGIGFGLRLRLRLRLRGRSGLGRGLALRPTALIAGTGIGRLGVLDVLDLFARAGV